MKTSLFIVALAVSALFTPSTSFSKVTLFSNAEAIVQVMNSSGLVNLEKTYGQISGLTIAEGKPSASVFQVFKLKLTLTANTPIGIRSCTVSAQVNVVKDEKAPAGITASKMADPVFSSPVCQK